MPITSPEEYLAAAPDAAHAWLRLFWGHVREKAPDLPVVMFRQVPMFQWLITNEGVARVWSRSARRCRVGVEVFR